MIRRQKHRQLQRVGPEISALTSGPSSLISLLMLRLEW